mgnify:CR=1 FL=1
MLQPDRIVLRLAGALAFVLACQVKDKRVVSLLRVCGL